MWLSHCQRLTRRNGQPMYIASADESQADCSMAGKQLNVFPGDAGIQFVDRSWTSAFAEVTKKLPDSGGRAAARPQRKS